ncbi:MAG: GNAT family N-acyltransferase [Acidobacteriota bacterium]
MSSTTASPEVCPLVSDSILEKLALPFPVEWLRRVLALDRLDHLWALASALAGPVFERLLTTLAVECVHADDDLRLVPRTGPAIVMANHPHGILDGMLAASLLERIRPDVKIISNSMLAFVPELSEKFIAVDVFGTRSAVGQNVKALRQAIRWLKNGGLLLVFPAGEVSRFSCSRRGVADGGWSPHFVDLARRVSAKIIPLFIAGSNSFLFHTISWVHTRLGTAMLPRELMKQRNRRVDVRIGQPINADALARFGTARKATAYVRFRVYLLANRNTLPSRAIAPAAANPIEPILTRLLVREIERLPDDAKLYTTDEYSVYIAHACEIPNALLEIGRLREVSFRAEGEGTGCSIDLDQFDDHYRHLFVWHNHQQEIVGAYRLGLSEEILPDRGPWGLYTTTLFRFPDSWWRSIAPAIELGRSFIRLEHQRNYGPLLALWRGIGAFLDKHPQYRYLFGPVSISGRYKAASKQLIASYLRPAAGISLSPEITAHTPPHTDFQLKRAVEQQPLEVLQLDDIDAMVKDIEPDRCGLPVLLRHYVNLGGRILAFNEDAHFSSSVDGLLLIDLLNADRRRLDRFLGKGVVERIAAAASSHFAA